MSSAVQHLDRKYCADTLWFVTRSSKFRFEILPLKLFLKNLPLLRLNTKEWNSDTDRFKMILESDQQIIEEILVFLCIGLYTDSKHKMIYKIYFFYV
jgi:hypothetical protein